MRARHGDTAANHNSTHFLVWSTGPLVIFFGRPDWKLFLSFLPILLWGDYKFLSCNCRRNATVIQSTKVKEQRLGPSACLGLCMLCMINQMHGLVCFRFTNLNICRKLKLFSRNDLHVYSATNLNTDSLKCESVNHIHTKYLLVCVSHFAVYCLRELDITIIA